MKVAAPTRAAERTEMAAVAHRPAAQGTPAAAAITGRAERGGVAHRRGAGAPRAAAATRGRATAMAQEAEARPISRCRRWTLTIRAHRAPARRPATVAPAAAALQARGPTTTDTRAVT